MPIDGQRAEAHRGKVPTMQINNKTEPGQGSDDVEVERKLASGVALSVAAARRKEAMAARRLALREFREGEVNLAGLVMRAIWEPDIARMRVSAVLGALARDRSAVENALKAAGIAPSRRLGWFLEGTGRCQALYDAFEHPGRPALPGCWIYE